MYDQNSNYVSAASVAQAIAESQIPYPYGCVVCPADGSPCGSCGSQQASKD